MIKKTILLLLLTAVFSSSSKGTTIYVKSNAQGANNGSSWNSAFQTLNAALSQASIGDSVWVAQGRYKPGNSRSSTFSIPAGVHVFGGFLGGETKIDQRNPSANPTILDGDLNDNDVGGIYYTNNTRSENTYSVVTFDNADNGLIDGFIIQGGNADGSTPGPMRYGAGVFITGVNAIDGVINVTVSNCTIQYCTAIYSCAVEARQYASTNGVPIDAVYRELTVRYNQSLGSVFGGGANTMGNTVHYSVTNSLIHNNESTQGYLLGLFSQQNGTVSAYYVNNTIANNRLASSAPIIGFGNYTSSGTCEAYFYNNIFYNNGGSVTFGQNPGLSSPISYFGFYNNLVQDANTLGSSAYANNVQAVPLFTDTLIGDFSLQPCSPGVNDGDTVFVNGANQDISFDFTGRQDIMNQVRFFSDAVDIGAFERGFDTSVTVTGNRITANATGSRYSYQWYDCNTGLALLNDTLPYLDVLNNGAYYVEITLDACLSARSRCIEFSNIGINELLEHGLSVYPNPATDYLLINTSSPIDYMRLVDIQGRVIRSYFGGEKKMSLEGLSPGVYILQVDQGATTAPIRIIKN